MAIKYVVRKGKNPQIEGSELYMGRFKMEDRIPFLKLANVISDQCSMTASDVKGIISALISQIKGALVDSTIVRLGDFGSLRCEVKSKLVDSEDDFSIKDIKGVKVVFTPGAQFRTACKGARYQAFRDITPESESSDD